MTNFELLMRGETFRDKGLTLEEVGQIICVGVQLTSAGCDECPFAEHCSLGHSGAVEFLKKEVVYVE